MATIANLGIAGAGLATAGGLVGGGYFVLKDNPQPVTQLLKIRNRQLLEKGKDDAEWKRGWQNYINEHTETVPNDEQPVPAEAKKPPAPKTKKVIKETDIWGLTNWKTDKDKPELVPANFQDKCEEKAKEQQAGIWTNAYQSFENFCTKATPSDDE